METASLIRAIQRIDDWSTANDQLPHHKQKQVMRILHKSIGMTDQVFGVIEEAVANAAFDSDIPKTWAFGFICHGVAIALAAVQHEMDEGLIPIAA
jgi:hypothetical protein